MRKVECYGVEQYTHPFCNQCRANGECLNKSCGDQADLTEYESWAIDPALIGIGGAPTRATTLPDDSEERKRYPLASGLLDYFPDALVAVANLSWVGNEKHNPGQPLHWARGKSADEADTLMRHFVCRGTVDSDGVPHSVKVAWRALALLQKEIEATRREEARGQTPDDRYQS